MTKKWSLCTANFFSAQSQNTLIFFSSNRKRLVLLFFCKMKTMSDLQIIRQMFQSLTTRRLGTRGQSRYHYYGLAVKPDSIYFSPGYSNRKYHPGFSSRYINHIYICKIFDIFHCEIMQKKLSQNLVQILSVVSGILPHLQSEFMEIS